MKIINSSFLIGSSYYPPFHSAEDWEKDTTNMRLAGLNMIRTAELLASWDYMEPRRGHAEWDWLDRLFELAQKNDLQMVLGTGSCNPPIWMMESYPDLQKVSREGMKYPLNTVWGWACTNHPGLRDEVSRWIHLLLERYGSHPSLYCWQIDNQIGHHNAFTGSEHSHPRQYGYWCYCNHCSGLFNTWIQNKYKDIETLNETWAWDPTHYRYYDWHQITPPRSMPAEWGNNTAWIDYRLFVKASLADYIRFQHDLIKSVDPQQLTMHNLYDCLRPDLGARNEPNHWDIAEIPDIIGHDIYPSENDYKKDPSYTSWFFDFAYSIAHHNDKSMWVPELESGPIGGYSAGPNFATSALDIKRFNIACLGHGAKNMLYQGYRDWNCIPLTWGALVDFHGEPTARYHAAAEIIQIVRDHEQFFLQALPPQAEIGIYYTHENVIALDGQANEAFLYKALRGAHYALWQQGYTVQFVEPRFLGTPTADYKVILLPFLMVLPQGQASKLANFVEQGGTLIGFAKLGHLDERGWAWDDRPGAGLTSLFGARETHIEVFREPHDKTAIQVQPDSPLFAGITDKRLAGYWHRQEWELASDTEVLAVFTDGAPAIIRRSHGQGQAILMATHLDMAAWEFKNDAVKKFFGNLVASCGVKKHLMITGEDQETLNERVDAHLLLGDNQAAVLINNEGDGAVEIVVTLPGMQGVQKVTDCFTQRSISFEEKDGIHFPLRLAAADGAIVVLELEN